MNKLGFLFVVMMMNFGVYSIPVTRAIMKKNNVVAVSAAHPGSKQNCYRAFIAEMKSGSIEAPLSFENREAMYKIAGKTSEESFIDSIKQGENYVDKYVARYGAAILDATESQSGKDAFGVAIHTDNDLAVCAILSYTFSYFI